MSVLKQPLFREITTVLIFKVAALFALYFLFFSPANRPDGVSSGGVLLGAPQAHSAQNGSADGGRQ